MGNRVREPASSTGSKSLVPVMVATDAAGGTDNPSFVHRKRSGQAKPDHPIHSNIRLPYSLRVDRTAITLMRPDKIPQTQKPRRIEKSGAAKTACNFQIRATPAKVVTRFACGVASRQRDRAISRFEESRKSSMIKSACSPPSHRLRPRGSGSSGRSAAAAHRRSSLRKP